MRLWEECVTYGREKGSNLQLKRLVKMLVLFFKFAIFF